MRINARGLTKALRDVEKRKTNTETKVREVLEQLVNDGYNVASARFSMMPYDGNKDVHLGIQWESDRFVTLYAEGEAVLFIEFGSGARDGYGHPQAQEFGYGPGTWSNNEALGGKGHWDDPNGWYYKHNTKSYGNPPARAMYSASTHLRARAEQIIRGVFK